MPEPRRWTLYDQSDDYNASWWIARDGHEQPPALKYAESVKVMPVEEHEQTMAALQAQMQQTLAVAGGAVDQAVEAETTIAALRALNDGLALAIRMGGAEQDRLRAELAKAREITEEKVDRAAQAIYLKSGFPPGAWEMDGTPRGMVRGHARAALEAALGHAEPAEKSGDSSLGQEERDDG